MAFKVNRERKPEERRGYSAGSQILRRAPREVEKEQTQI
jgi:hypothetical protein